jgi:hypothetical protein
MSKRAFGILVGAAALAGCNVNVTSNDAATRNAIDDVREGAADLLNGAEVVAGDAGNELVRAADAAGNGIDRIGERAKNVDVDVNVDSNSAK